MNALKKRKGIVGSSALNLVSSWKQLVNEASKPKPKIVVEPCHSPSSEDENDEDENDEDEDDEDVNEEVTESISHSRLLIVVMLSINYYVYAIKFQHLLFGFSFSQSCT